MDANYGMLIPTYSSVIYAILVLWMVVLLDVSTYLISIIIHIISINIYIQDVFRVLVHIDNYAIVTLCAMIKMCHGYTVYAFM